MITRGELKEKFTSPERVGRVNLLDAVIHRTEKGFSAMPIAVGKSPELVAASIRAGHSQCSTTEVPLLYRFVPPRKQAESTTTEKG